MHGHGHAAKAAGRHVAEASEGGYALHWGYLLTAFGGALVEFVEAAVIVIAAATLAGWGPALYGTLAAAGILAVAVAVLGVGLLHAVPLPVLRAIIGALLLLFGVKWLSKATVRLGRPRRGGGHGGESEDASPHAAFLTAFNGVLLEGAEVVFIVLALGVTGRALGSAIVGAVAAGLLCVIAAAVARGPLGRVPEVTLKFAVGIMLTSFGTLWLGEALGVPWWGADASVIWLAIGNLALAWLAVRLLRSTAPHHVQAGGEEA